MRKSGLLLSALMAFSAAGQVIKETGVKGGLVVCVGADAIEQVSSDWKNENFIFQCLETDQAKISNLRESFRAAGIYGKVTAEVFDGTSLPFADNIVNLLIVGSGKSVSGTEMKRVLAPGGVAVVNGKQVVKTRPDTIDDWTHFMHSADNNAVSKDLVVDSPHHVQWVGSPLHAKSHSKMTTINVMVSGGGRLFYIVDEGPTALSKSTPAQWSLYARDAFNGVTLWKRDISSWNPYGLNSRHHFPVDLYRRLVAGTNRVFATLAIFGPVSALDPATGETLHTYAGTEKTEEIIHDDGVLYLVINSAAAENINRRALSEARTVADQKRITAIEADSGRVLWTKQGPDTFGLMPMTLVAKKGRIYFHNTKHVISCDAKNGTELWRAPRPSNYGRPGWSTSTLVVTDDVVLSADRSDVTIAMKTKILDEVEGDSSESEGKDTTRKKMDDGNVMAFSAATGKLLWTGLANEGSHTPIDVFVAQNKLYVGEGKGRSVQDYRNARDPLTGKVVNEIPMSLDWTDEHHHRCYRDKATERFILSGRTGVEFIDLESGEITAHNWIRGICKYGILPSNGLLYITPDQCGCYIEGKLPGFHALAPARPMGKSSRDPDPNMQRLEKGPAYGAIDNKKSKIKNDEWPTYRGNNARGGSTAAVVSADLKPAWTARLSAAGRLSPLTAADGKVFVAQVDAHQVHAIDASTGKVLWSYSTASRVDSPPTITGGLAVFGCRDGRVYAVRVSDGQLVWRYLAAPWQRSVVVDDQLESVWPIHGSVLVKDGAVYCAAGRNSNIDGGVYMVKLDLDTGRSLDTRQFFSRNLEDNRSLNLYEPFRGAMLPERELPGVKPDIPSSDGKNIFMCAVSFNDRLEIQSEHQPHLFCPSGFLDNSWWERTYWIYGNHFYSGAAGIPYAKQLAPNGRLLVFDGTTIYGYNDENTKEDMFATQRIPNLKSVPAKKAGSKKFANASNTKIINDWMIASPVFGQAMALTSDIFFMAGPLKFDTKAAADELQSSSIDQRELTGVLQEALDAFEGRGSGQVLAVSKSDGRIVSQFSLESTPVFDGMAIAGGKLFISTAAGTIECFAPSSP